MAVCAKLEDSSSSSDVQPSTYGFRALSRTDSFLVRSDATAYTASATARNIAPTPRSFPAPVLKNSGSGEPPTTVGSSDEGPRATEPGTYDFVAEAPATLSSTCVAPCWATDANDTTYWFPSVCLTAPNAVLRLFGSLAATASPPARSTSSPRMRLSLASRLPYDIVKRLAPAAERSVRICGRVVDEMSSKPSVNSRTLGCSDLLASTSDAPLATASNSALLGAPGRTSSRRSSTVLWSVVGVETTFTSLSKVTSETGSSSPSVETTFFKPALARSSRPPFAIDAEWSSTMTSERLTPARASGTGGSVWTSRPSSRTVSSSRSARLPL